jgi:hypothetical protein
MLLGSKLNGGVAKQPYDAKHHDIDIPSTLEDVSVEYMEHALRLGGALPRGVRVVTAKIEAMSLQGLLSDVGRARLTYSGPSGAVDSLPASVVVKMQASNETNRAVGMACDCYAMEARVYEHLTKSMAVGTARCFNIDHDGSSGNYVFVMEDIVLREGAYAVNQLRGCAQAEAMAVAESMGRLHAQYWSWSEPLPSWLPNTSDIDARDVGRLVAQCGDAYLTTPYFTSLDANAQAAVKAALELAVPLASVLRTGPRTLVHHDARADNLFWEGEASASSKPVIFLDWQIAGQGVGAIDLAWFVAGSIEYEPLEPAREDKDRALVEAYWRTLTAGGVDAARYTLEACWRDYLLGALWSFLVLTQAVKFGPAADPPSGLIWTMMRRHTATMVQLSAHEVPLERLV